MLRLHMIPTNGDATLLRFTENGREINILIDGGNRKNDCLSYLKSQRLTKLHLMIVSHLDEDHIRGLRRVADEISVDELWITDVSAFIKPAAESIYMMKCCYESMLVIDGKGVRSGNKFAVYDGFQRQIGPFFLEVLSPPKSLHDYLKRPKVIERILSSPKGKSISRYVQDKIKKRLQEENVGEDQEYRDKVVSEVVEQFDVDVPQIREIEDLLESEDVDWNERDHFYEATRSLFNDISIVVKITFDYLGVRETFLFPGDLTNWSLVMARHHKAIKGCVTKVPHHGSHIYVNADDLTQYLFSEGTPHVFWKRLPPPWRYIWEEWYDLVRHFGRPPLLWPIPIAGTGQWLAGDLDSRGVYEHLSPTHSLVYPYRSSFRLPRLDVRNAIKAHSIRTTCNFDQGKVSVAHRRGDEACMDCYGCKERNTATVLEWA